MMCIYKYIKNFCLIALMIAPCVALAVTKEEMEQARTIAAKAYLRYANDGSGYLDELNPKTIEELEAQLKTKEKENIKAFKAIPIPADFQSWGKEKLVDYWAVSAFQNKGLLEKGRGGRIRARAQINKMTLSAPKPVETKSEAPKTETQEQPKEQNKPAAADSLASPRENNINTELNEIANLGDEDVVEGNVEKATNYTWVYIMVLAILVALVIALVVYAVNLLKKNASNSLDGAVASSITGVDPEELEHYKNLAADKDVDIAMLNKKLESAQRQNSELKAKVDALMAEIATLKSATRVQASNAESLKGATPKKTLRSIYLGRANSKGIFVRADRTLNVGNSIFVLETSDGYSGSFKVADSPAAWSLAFSNPKEYLETACTGYDLDDTADASKIITESSGTAVFEGGCWRVIRKARIRYQ